MPAEFFRSHRNQVKIINLLLIFLILFHYFSLLFFQRENFRRHKIMITISTTPPMLPKFTLSPILTLIPNTAKIASRIPTSPSPAIIPAQYSVPSVVCFVFVSSSTFFTTIHEHTNNTTDHDGCIQVNWKIQTDSKWHNRYS